MGTDLPASITADLVYREGRFERDLTIALDPAGRITGLEPGGEAELRLDGRAILPGAVNGHSHAFQRAIRGRTSGSRSSGTSHFWSWRRAMYGVVRELGPDEVHAHSLRAFREMAAAGYTGVGEFHYLHRDPSGASYGDPNLLGRRVIEAAREAGLRIVLLNAYYERGGLRDEPLEGAQRRFDGGDLEAFLDRTETLAREYRSDPAVSVGLAVHSVRAVRPESLELAFQAARARGWPCHIHLSEQRAEVEECRAVHGRTPVELTADRGGLGPGTTGVHCTHISDDEIALLAGSDASVCACPTTEADLGDGFLRAGALRAAGVPISLGSDSQVRIDPWEEMRAVEYHERLRSERRNVLAEASGEPMATELIAMATRWGARALGLATGELAPGRWADLVAIDLAAPILEGWDEETLAPLLALHADPRCVDGVYVAGRRIV